MAFVPPGGFEAQTVAWQTATVFFAVINLVAAVGLWLAAPWGAVVWLTSAVSMVVIEIAFPAVFDDPFVIVLFQPVVIVAYLVLVCLGGARTGTVAVDKNPYWGGRRGAYRVYWSRQHGPSHGSQSAQGGHRVAGFDVAKAGVDALAKDGGAAATSATQACADADVVITMLPAGRHVREVYSGNGGVIAAAKPDTLLIDLVNHRRGVRTRSRGRGGGARAAYDRCPRVGWRRRRAGGHAHIHGRRAGCGVRSGQSRSWKRWERTSCTLAVRATDKPRRSATT